MSEAEGICANQSASLSVDRLNELFLVAYQLDIPLEPERIKRPSVIPGEVSAVRANGRFCLRTNGG